MTIILIFTLTIIGFLIQAFFLHIITKLFKIKNSNYKTAVKILILEWLATIVIGIMFGIIFSLISVPVNFSYIVVWILSFMVFHALLKKYYLTIFKKNIIIYILLIIIVVITSLSMIIPIRAFIMQPFYIKGESMNPTLENGEYTFIKIFDKNFQRGDIIVYKHPEDEKQFFIHRIIGLPNEKIQIKNGKIYIYNNKNLNGLKLPEDYLNPETKTYALNENIINIEKNKYYILGDNRSKSQDSRIFGLLDKELIVGKYWFSPPIK